MPRQFEPAAVRERVQQLRNRICPIGSLSQQTRTAVHLQLGHAGELFGFIGRLDSHPLIAGKPSIKKTGAFHQSVSGTTANPAAHVLPCGVTLNGRSPADWFKGAAAKKELRRIFGLTLLAPEDYVLSGGYTSNPVVLNKLDSRLEGFRRRDGLASAMVRTIDRFAVDQGQWDGSGRVRRDDSLVIELIDASLKAYRQTAIDVHQRVAVDLESDLKDGLPEADRARAIVSLDMVRERLNQFIHDRSDPRTIAKPVLDTTRGEPWAADVE